MIQNLTCISCPMGCPIQAELNDAGEIIRIEGYSCPVGKKYAQEEVTAPKRVLTALIPVMNSSKPLPVKTDRGIPKELIFTCLEEISHSQAVGPVSIGDVILRNLCETGANLIATANHNG